MTNKIASLWELLHIWFQLNDSIFCICRNQLDLLVMEETCIWSRMHSWPAQHLGSKSMQSEQLQKRRDMDGTEFSRISKKRATYYKVYPNFQKFLTVNFHYIWLSYQDFLSNSLHFRSSKIFDWMESNLVFLSDHNIKIINLTCHSTMLQLNTLH